QAGRMMNIEHTPRVPTPKAVRAINSRIHHFVKPYDAKFVARFSQKSTSRCFSSNAAKGHALPPSLGHKQNSILITEF
ncbi:MAG TPA: hypothetical protein VGI34_02065, partial [Candidatus Acidoferrales bacterium]